MHLMAMRIVITNDDGFESRNLQALYAALKANGHDVILSAPFQNQSGTSAQLGGLTDIGPTSTPSPGSTVAANQPGVGPTTIAPDQYYVNSTPTAAVLYGIDIAGLAKWKAGPDLVISGPNIGNNLGGVTPHSGTVGAAIAALNRGIPAIAVSGANGNVAAAPLLAEITLRIVTAFENQGRITLPAGVGLNVNVPVLDSKRTAASYRFAFTQIGSGANPTYTFQIHAGDSPAPFSPRAPIDNSPGSEVNAFADGNTVTISPIQGTYQAQPEQAAEVLKQGRELFNSALAVSNPKLVNISTRAFVGVGAAVQITGFMISGPFSKTVLIRASGPALAAFGIAGALPDPVVALYDSSNRLVASNDNWSANAIEGTAIAAAAETVGAFPWPLGSKDAALIAKVAAGTYTVVVRGVTGDSGISLVEVYDVTSN
jgi:5'-nucleotidase